MNKYKLSQFNIYHKISNENYLVYNTFTQGMLKLNNEYYDMLLNIEKDSSLINNKFIEYGLVVEGNSNEINMLKYNNRVARYDNLSADITIKTTNSCNFMCKYCYQTHTTDNPKKENIDRIKNFLKLKIEGGLKELFIHWFGGEPLINFNLIQDIEEFLKPFNITYKSSITTNGYLIDDSLINSIKSTNISFLQITIDGVEDIHNKTRVLRDGSGTFNIIMENIKKCLNNGIAVVLRCNINKNNENVAPLLEYLKNNNMKNKKLSLHFNEATKHDVSYTDEDIFYDTQSEYANKLLSIYKELVKYGYNIPLYPRISVGCAFDKINNFLIDVDSSIYQCSSCDDERLFYLGEIQNDGRLNINKAVQYEKLLYEPFENPECLSCKVLPMCLGGCSYKRKKGKEYCIPEKYIMYNLIELYYKAKVLSDERDC